MKKVFIYLYGEELWKQQEPLWLKDLYHEAAQWNESKECINCESRLKAIEVIGFKETRKRSLLGLSCSQF
jgi:tRNA A22 N-methylase